MPTNSRRLAQDPPNVPAGKGKLRIFADKLSGFIMEVRETGSVSFYIRYSDARARQREIRLGRLGEVTVDQARKRAHEIKAEASLGGDSAANRDRLKAVLTFSSFIEDRYLLLAKGRLRPYHDYESFYFLRLNELWGRRRLDEVRPHDVAELQDRLRKEGLSNASVNRYAAFIRRVFNLALRWEAYEGRTPAQHAEMRREQHRERYLGESELRMLLRALELESNKIAAGVIALLAATGARRGEAMNARWEHIDLDRRLWIVQRSKPGNAPRPKVFRHTCPENRSIGR
jgi:integrase